MSESILLSLDKATIANCSKPNDVRVEATGELGVILSKDTVLKQQILSQCKLPVDESETHIVFIRCGDVRVPIRKHPVLKKTEEPRYTFALPGQFLEVALDTTECDADEIAAFEGLLTEYGCLRSAQAAARSPQLQQGDDSMGQDKNEAAEKEKEKEKENERIKQKAQDVAQSIVQGGSKGGEWIDSGAKALNSWLHASGEYIASKTTPVKPVEISDDTKRNLEAAKVTAAVAVDTSKTLVQALGEVTGALSSTIVNVVQNSSLGEKHKDNPALTTLTTVGAATVVAGTQLLSHLAGGAKTVAGAAGEGVTKVVTKRYGEEAGEVSKDSCAIAGDAIQSVSNLQGVYMKGLAMSTAKQTAQKTYDATTHPHPAQPPSPPSAQEVNQQPSPSLPDEEQPASEAEAAKLEDEGLPPKDLA